MTKVKVGDKELKKLDKLYWKCWDAYDELSESWEQNLGKVAQGGNKLQEKLEEMENFIQDLQDRAKPKESNTKIRKLKPKRRKNELAG